MKSLALLLFILSSASFATDCFSIMEYRLVDIVPEHTFTVTDSNVYFGNNINPIERSLIYNDYTVEGLGQLLNGNAPAYRAEVETAGCYGYEYVFFEPVSCKILGIGGGYCD